MGDHEQTLSWVDRIKDRPNARQTAERVWHRIDAMLLAQNRHTEYGTLIPAPVATARVQIHAWTVVNASPFPKEIPEAHAAAMRQRQRADLIESVAVLHASLLLADRPTEADQIAADLIAAMPGCEAPLGIAAKAVVHDVADERHLKLLDACDTPWRTEDLRRQINAAIAAR